MDQSFAYSMQALTANGLGVVLIISLMLNMRRKLHSRAPELRVFFIMLCVNLVQCVAEAAAIVLNGRLFPSALELATLANTVLFIGNIAFASLWSIYADFHVHSEKRRLTLRDLLLYSPALIIMSGSVVNFFTPVYFRITDANIYERTPLFFITFAVTYLYLTVGTVIAYGDSRKSERYVFLPAATFLFPVVLASILQVIFAGISLLWVGAAIGLTSAYISLLDENSSIDALSGAFSRHQLNRSLESMLGPGRGDGRVVGIMLDIDNFKQINDRYGHMVGDEAIRAVGRILRRALASRGSVYRYAGDEFTILMRTRYEGQTEDVLTRIRAEADAYNAESQLPCPLSFSLGHAVYVEGESAGDFIKRIDVAMYEDKKFKHLRTGSAQSPLLPDDTYLVNPDRNCVLIVDDDFINRELLKNIFPSQYRILEAENGQEALSILSVQLNNICAILLDLHMPEMNGMELLRILRERDVTARLPVFLITANSEFDISREAYELGAMDVISKPIIPFVILRRVQSVLELFRTRESLQAQVHGQEQQLLENAHTIESLHLSTIEALASAIEFRDMESGEHVNRIYAITHHILDNTVMGKGFTPTEIENMAIGAIMHDVGKIAISDMILNKPGRLTAEEFEIMKRHTSKGAELLAHITRTQSHPSYAYARDIALHHHERWDGNGYPEGLKGDEISVWSQVVSIADVYDALISPRVYKKAISPDEAVDMIRSGQCGVFNPLLLECFLSVEPTIRQWYEPDGVIVGDRPSGMPSLGSTAPEVINVMLLVDAVRTAYDMILSVNLTQNSYAVIDHRMIHESPTIGVFDELMEHVFPMVPPSHKDIFMNTFSRAALLEHFRAGKRRLTLTYPEWMDNGTLRTVTTTVIFMEDERNGDILEITLSRYINPDEDDSF